MRGLPSDPAPLPPRSASAQALAPPPTWRRSGAAVDLSPLHRSAAPRRAVTIDLMHHAGSVSDLMIGARNAVDVCLAVKPGERVALIADEPSREVAASLEQALADREAVIDAVLIESVARRPLRGAPREVLAALEH